MNEWGLAQAPAAQPMNWTPTIVGVAAGATVGGVIGYLMNPRLLSVAIPAVLLGGMFGAVGYSMKNLPSHQA